VFWLGGGYVWKEKRKQRDERGLVSGREVGAWEVELRVNVCGVLGFLGEGGREKRSGGRDQRG